MAGAHEHRGPRTGFRRMRQRFGLNRPRSMAQRSGRDALLDLSPRARLIGGWLAAVLLVLGIALAVRILGGNADGSAVLPSASPSAGAGALPITFGTQLGTDRLVPGTAETTRFVADDLFCYSVADAEPATTVYVGVRRTAGGPIEVVQPAVDGQAIPDAPANIGFQVPAANLFAAFGPGTFEMTIALEPEGVPIAVGSFELIGDGGPPASSSPGG